MVALQMWMALLRIWRRRFVWDKVGKWGVGGMVVEASKQAVRSGLKCFSFWCCSCYCEISFSDKPRIDKLLSRNMITNAVRDEPSNVFFHQAVISWTFRMKMTASFVKSTISRTAQIQVSILDECDVSLKIYQCFNYFFFVYIKDFHESTCMLPQQLNGVYMQHSHPKIPVVEQVRMELQAMYGQLASWATNFSRATYLSVRGTQRGETWRWWWLVEIFGIQIVLSWKSSYIITVVGGSVEIRTKQCPTNLLMKK